jgi:hypothetical protein
MITQATIEKTFEAELVYRLLFPVASVIMSMSPTTPSGFLPLDGSTIGSGASAATYKGEKYRDLFNILKNAEPNAGTEDFDSNNVVIIRDVKGKVPVALDSGVTIVNKIGKIGGDLNHDHNIPADNTNFGASPGLQPLTIAGHNHQGETGQDQQAFSVFKFYIKY